MLTGTCFHTTLIIHKIRLSLANNIPFSMDIYNVKFDTSSKIR